MHSSAPAGFSMQHVLQYGGGQLPPLLASIIAPGPSRHLPPAPEALHQCHGEYNLHLGVATKHKVYNSPNPLEDFDALNAPRRDTIPPHKVNWHSVLMYRYGGKRPHQHSKAPILLQTESA